jgi:hypothetical protein
VNSHFWYNRLETTIFLDYCTLMPKQIACISSEKHRFYRPLSTMCGHAAFNGRNQRRKTVPGVILRRTPFSSLCSAATVLPSANHSIIFS